MVIPADILKLVELFVALSEKLSALNTSILAWQAAQGAMMTALDETNIVVAQINAMRFGISIPEFSVPVTTDPDWVQSILDNAAHIQAQSDALKAATPSS